MSKGHMTIRIRTEDEMQWHSTYGSDDVDAWAAAHGWKASDIVSGSVRVELPRDGIGTVHAVRYLSDADGKHYFDPENPDEVATEEVTAELVRALPRGIGQVVE